MPETINDPTLTPSNVRVGVSGSINLAVLGTALPTGTTGGLDPAFMGLGFLSSDGLTETFELSRETIRAWQNAASVREVINESKLMYSGTLIETTGLNVEVYYATEVDTLTGSYVITPGATSGRVAGVFTVIDGAEVKVITVAECEVFKGGDAITYATGQAIGYPIEIICYTDPVVYDSTLVA